MPHEKTRPNRRGKYQYEPKQVDEIIVRQFAFEFPDDLDDLVDSATH